MVRRRGIITRRDIELGSRITKIEMLISCFRDKIRVNSRVRDKEILTKFYRSTVYKLFSSVIMLLVENSSSYLNVRSEIN